MGDNTRDIAKANVHYSRVNTVDKSRDLLHALCKPRTCSTLTRYSRVKPLGKAEEMQICKEGAFL